MRFLLPLLAACSIGDDPQRFVLAGEDVVVERDALRAPVATHAELLDATTGDLVAGIQGGGYVRRILDLDRQGELLVLATEDVPLGEAVGDADSQLNEGKADATELRLGFSVDDVILHDADGITIEIERGSLAFTPRLDLDLELSGASLEHFMTALTGTLDGEIVLDVRAPAAGTWNLAKTTWTDSTTLVQWIGWVPVVEVIELRAGVGVEIASEGPIDVTARADFSARLRAGIEYRGDWNGIGEAELERHGDVTATVLSPITIKSYVFAEVRIQIYGTAGPYIALRPGLDFRRGTDGTWTRKVRLTADGGAELQIPFGDRLHYDTRLVDSEWGL
jgi:hypothetical protein